MGGRGASFNIPVARSGGPRTTVGLPNSRRLRSGQLESLKTELLAVLHQQLFAPGSTGQQLWELGLVSRLLADGSLGARPTGLLAVIETPEALEGYLLRAQGQDDAKRRAQRCIEAAFAIRCMAATVCGCSAKSLSSAKIANGSNHQIWPTPSTSTSRTTAAIAAGRCGNCQGWLGVSNLRMTHLGLWRLRFMGLLLAKPGRIGKLSYGLDQFLGSTSEA